jgi:AcrR family transcriptional regulator
MLAETATRGRPRSSQVDDAIRQATLDLLAEAGYDGLTMATVAADARVSTATLYRRFRSKEDLVVGVLFAAAEETPVPDTGSLAGDCRAVVRDLLAGIREPHAGLVLAGLVSAMSRNPVLAVAMRRNLIAPRRSAFKAILRRARDRGEIDPALDDDLVIDLLFGPVHHRLLVTGQPLTPGVADRLADLVVRAVSTGSTGPTA